MQIKSIGIVGGGVVGKATARTYLEYAEVRVWDIVPERSTHSLLDVLRAELVFVCLPTPQKEGSLEMDISALTQFFDGDDWPVDSDKDFRDTNFVLKSTVPIGTTWKLREEYCLPNLIHSPEFLTERCAMTDAMLPARNVIGGYGYAAGLLHSVYHARFPGVPIYHMTSDESEAVKLFTNSFFAVKIAFFNEIRALADKLKLDWDRVLNGILSDGRIAHSHTHVPGRDNRRGFGGKCLPKDLACLATFPENEVIAAALRRNKRDRQ